MAEKEELIEQLFEAHMKELDSSEIIDAAIESGSTIEELVDSIINRVDSKEVDNLADKAGECFTYHGDYLIIKCPTQKEMESLRGFCVDNNLKIIEP